MRKWSDARRANQIRLLCIAALPLIAGGSWFHVFPTGLSPHHGYPDRVLPAMTGGFGEATCRSCHFDAPLNDTQGNMGLLGIPDTAVSGSRYTLTVTVSHPELRRAGFQITVRDSVGRQAGLFKSLDERTLTQAAGDNDVAYMNHSEAGSEPTGKGMARWEFEWVPAKSGTVFLHWVANAGNGDESALGDFVYSDSTAVVVSSQ